VQYHLQALQEVPNLSKGLSECITAWKESGKSSSMVDLALSSLALVVFSRIQQHPLAATEASSRYYHLLRVAQKRIGQLAVPTLHEQNIDAWLLATALMSRYEGATVDPSCLQSSDLFTSRQRWSHHDGLKAILNVWHDNSNHHAPAFIVMQTRRELIKSLLLRALPLPGWMEDGSRLLYSLI
jgi:hypothetical protein